MLPLVPLTRPQANASRKYDDRQTYKPQLTSSSVGLAQARPTNITSEMHDIVGASLSE